MNPVNSIDGNLNYVPRFLTQTDANELFEIFRTGLAWSEEHFKIYGKTILMPRLICWYGDKKATYQYSGINHIPHQWTEPLMALKEKLQQYSGQKYNSVLGNLYRNGNDSMGWHADNEKELGGQPFIASVSLGEKRLFKARHNNTKQRRDIVLESGSLLTMSGTFQNYWQHCIPKTRSTVGPRINLTFRFIIPSR